jgi:uncharacterized membrane protein
MELPNRRVNLVLLVVDLLLVVGLAVFAFAAFPTLPDRYPVHFGISGQPDRWVAGSSPEWFLLLGVAVAFNAVLLGTGFGLPRINPRWINIPRKAQFLQLPRERQIAVLSGVTTMVLALAALFDLVFVGLYAMIYATAVRALASPLIWPIVIPIALALIGLAVWTTRIGRAIGRATDRTGGSRP